MMKDQGPEGRRPGSSTEDYLKTFVTPIIDQLVSEMVSVRPTDVVSFCHKWFRQLQLSSHPDKDSEDKDNEVARLSLHSRRRGGIRENKHPQILHQNKSQSKSEYLKSKILFACAQLFMFKSFAEEEMNRVIEGMTEKKMEEGEVLLQAGDHIDALYLVGEGELIGRDKQMEVTKTFPSDSTIGELSLLYEQKSTHTVTATRSTTLYKLPVEIYSEIIEHIKLKSNHLFEESISQSSVLRGMTCLEKARLHDIVTTVVIPEGAVIQRADEGRRVLIVCQGKVQLLRRMKGTMEVVSVYNGGDHIQEDMVDWKSMLLKAKMASKLLCLDKDGFNRLFGPYERFLGRQRVGKSRSKGKHPLE